MLTYIIVPSVNEVKNLKAINDEADEDIKVLVIDEGNQKIRARNAKNLTNVPNEYFGPGERKQWFEDNFGSAYKKYMSLIPERCHAETSFGFLLAYTEGANIVIEVDDDVYKIDNFVEEHTENLTREDGMTVHAKGKWYNTLENLMLTVDFGIYPRGHPYDLGTRQEHYFWTEGGGECVLNMGLWLGHPDLGALTLAYHGGLDGRCVIKSKACRRDKVVVGEDTYFAVCSMNTSFKTRIMPAFYQLYMNTLGIDRFDDIWSGLFLKKIVDHLGEKMCLGKPLCVHTKRGRDVFKDLRKELEGVVINEKLWRIIDEAELSSKSYADCYLELAEHIDKNVERQFKEPIHVKFMKLQVEKMRTWVEALDKLS